MRHFSRGLGWGFAGLTAIAQIVLLRNQAVLLRRALHIGVSCAAHHSFVLVDRLGKLELNVARL
jgi:hypothetical protein